MHSLSGDQLHEMYENVGYIRGRIDGLVEDSANMDDRIRSLERKWWSVPITAVVALLSVLHPGHYFGN